MERGWDGTDLRRGGDPTAGPSEVGGGGTFGVEKWSSSTVGVGGGCFFQNFPGLMESKPTT